MSSFQMQLKGLSQAKDRLVDSTVEAVKNVSSRISFRIKRSSIPESEIPPPPSLAEDRESFPLNSRVLGRSNAHHQKHRKQALMPEQPIALKDPFAMNPSFDFEAFMHPREEKNTPFQMSLVGSPLITVYESHLEDSAEAEFRRISTLPRMPSDLRMSQQVPSSSSSTLSTKAASENELPKKMSEEHGKKNLAKLFGSDPTTGGNVKKSDERGKKDLTRLFGAEPTVSGKDLVLADPTNVKKPLFDDISRRRCSTVLILIFLLMIMTGTSAAVTMASQPSANAQLGNVNGTEDGSTLAPTVEIILTLQPTPPTLAPSNAPTTKAPTNLPTSAPTRFPTNIPTKQPTRAPTVAPTKSPTDTPTKTPTRRPTNTPTRAPTHVPTRLPTQRPTNTPTYAPTKAPTKDPTNAPTRAPTDMPTEAPTDEPTRDPTSAPTNDPTEESTPAPEPTKAPRGKP